jgi:hypothetical protein
LPAPSSNAHTYRLLIFKEQADQTALLHPANRFVRQQRRSEIMQRVAIVVNFFLLERSWIGNWSRSGLSNT